MAPDSTDGVSSCACKGIRRCLRCENRKGQLDTNGPKVVHRFIYDPETRMAVHKDAEVASFPFPGVFLWENFITEEEEEELTSTMDQDRR